MTKPTPTEELADMMDRVDEEVATRLRDLSAENQRLRERVRSIREYHAGTVTGVYHPRDGWIEVHEGRAMSVLQQLDALLAEEPSDAD